MARVDDLPADQKAVIQLLLKQGKTYDELAALLRLDGAGVRDRALDALDSLGPDDTGDLESERQDDISDFLLGQQTASQRAATREFLETSAAGRAWARVVAAELRPIGGDALPDIPAGGREVDEAFDALEARKVARQERAKSSRLGGLLVLIGVGVAIAVGGVLLIGGGDDESDDTPTTTQAASTGPTGTPSVDAQINLTAAVQGSKALGVAQVLSQDGQRALAVTAQDLQPSSRYVVWLYNSPSDAQFLGFAPPVGDDGRLSGLAPVPAEATKFRQLVITKEKVDRPSKPGTIVLRGQLDLGGN
ncbi:hypothetical protein [Paraconexibacter algicola]|uniref:Anti-sigma factor n=1 Tax=Paraconexibacter algicola TaxID=2133960 RepID=A0A2T4UCU1_9ACTN|nr:hypothetical protein [Paraconexibacter algicola]PTL55040.1 hypothetical protein C7Y72_20940 [Paraconexibacter algicola]